jgi:hypothetical protein
MKSERSVEPIVNVHLLSCIENLSIHWSRIQTAEVKYLRTVKGCTRLDQIRNEDIRNELGISPLSEKIIEYRNK